jgi:hypothetical protein
MRYTQKRNYRDSKIVSQEVVVTKKKKIKKQTQKKGFFRRLWDRINPFGK